MKLWVDDERPAPEGFTRAASSDEAILHLIMRTWDEVSVDHDLGGEDTGFVVLDWMIEHNVWPAVLTIHTANPPARKRMLAAANAEAPADTDIYVITDHAAVAQMGCLCGGNDCAIVQFTATQDSVTWSPIERIVETQAGNAENANKGSE